MRYEFRLQGGIGFANAVRRSLISDTTSWAPHEIHVRSNTSCQTDEFLAHRIGLIPFRKTSNPTTEELKLTAHGPCVVRCDAFRGAGFEPIYPSIHVMELGDGQQLDLSVSFGRGTGRKHARYATVSAVGLSPSPEDGSYVLSFESHPDDARERVEEALMNLKNRVDAALQSLGSESPPPTSMI